jgi:hypothetical protein
MNWFPRKNLNRRKRIDFAAVDGSNSIPVMGATICRNGAGNGPDKKEMGLSKLFAIEWHNDYVAVSPGILALAVALTLGCLAFAWWLVGMWMEMGN